MHTEGIEEFDGLLTLVVPCEEGDCYESKGPECSRYKLNSVRGNYDGMRKDGTLCDVTLLVGPDKVAMKAHRVILAGASDFFKSMFTSGFRETHQSEVELPNLYPEHMEIMLNLFYSDSHECFINKKDGTVIAAMAGYLQCRHLEKLCCEYITHRVCFRDKLKAHKFAKKFGLELLRQAMEEEILENFEFLCESVADDVDEEEQKKYLSLLLEFATNLKCMDSSCYNKGCLEKYLFDLLWDIVTQLDKKDQEKFIPTVLQAVHLPALKRQDFSEIEQKVEHIPEARKIMEKAKEKHGPLYITSPSDCLDLWCLPRCRRYSGKEFCFVFDLDNFQKVTSRFSQLVLLGGVPVCVYVVISRAFRPDKPSFKMEVTAIPKSSDPKDPIYPYCLDIGFCHSEIEYQSVAKATNPFTLTEDSLAEVSQLKVQVKLRVTE